jgi:O-acetylserine/cysteine efflux transporter
VKPLHVALILLVMMIWGFNFVVVKFGLMLMPPFTFVALRFLVVALMLLPFIKPPPRWRELAALSVTLGILHFSLMFTGLKRIDASTAAIAVQLQVPFAAIMAAFFFKDRIGWRRMLGMAVAFAGVALVAGEPRFNGNYLPLGLVIAAAFVWAFANIQIKMVGDAVDVMALNGWIATLAFPQLLVVALLTEGNPIETVPWDHWGVWAVLAFQSVLVTLVGYGIWYRMMRHFPVNQVMPFTLSIPMFGVLSGILFLEEPLTWLMVIGGVATLAGVAICVIRRPALAEPATKGGL